MINSAIYGGLDGLITTAVLSESAHATGIGVSAILTLCISNLVADAVSMAFGDYLSNTTDPFFECVMGAIVTFLSFLAFGCLPLVPTMIGIRQTTTLQRCLSAFGFLVLGSMRVFFMAKGRLIQIISTMILGGTSIMIANLITKWQDVQIKEKQKQ